LNLAEVGHDEVSWGEGAPVICEVVHDEELQQWVLPLVGAKCRAWVREEGEQELMKASDHKLIRGLGCYQEAL
jgi:hypothetical protein